MLCKKIRNYQKTQPFLLYFYDKFFASGHAQPLQSLKEYIQGQLYRIKGFIT